ncbi:MAG: amidohydrolase family protein [Cyclobacteriaceae bacterium]|nr:amidohydrolase family protein [Cyclobacteriaceae bacterium]MCB0499351.1 amidohydrolase family protein [Cyclobacteriaceae bacterium]MCB9236429.1 amidohydrolase family protein [Flammeovirgaceae bacterium]MCO5272252.1 amidohydrolase family protein [Cyclobacteriaceae bacterium]MCW5902110.1 amidohydrolase family protein [Cyclobacteriaceae bacterium]
MKKFKITLTLILLVTGWGAWAQETFPRNDVKDDRAGQYAFTNATIVVDPQTTLQNATLLIKGDKVEQVGANLSVPKGYVSIDLKGKYIYPSLIDMFTNYGLPEVERPSGSPYGGREQIQSKTKGAYNANQAVKAHYNAADEFTIDSKTAEGLRKSGFGAVLTSKYDGLARGTGAFVSLSEKNDNTAMVLQKAAAEYSFAKGSSTQTYPVSLMGFIAVLRQTHMDADWFGSQNPRPFADNTLEAWIQNQKLPQVFDAGSWANVLRADKLGDEFGTQYIIKGGGDEYQRIKEIKASNATLIEPINFPDAYDVEDPFDAQKVTLEEMKHWELAPANLASLEQNGIEFAITTAGLKKVGDFLPNMRKAISNGLTESTALKALTTTPARLLKLDGQVGSLKKGMLANFIITSGKLFDDKTVIHQNWVQGEPYAIKPLNVRDFSGTYNLSINGQTYNLEVTGEAGSHKAKIKSGEDAQDVSATFDNDLVTFSFKPTKDSKGSIRLSGWTEENGWKGKGQLIDGTWVTWTGTRTGDASAQSNDKGQNGGAQEGLGKVIYPFNGHGYPSLPVMETLLIKNATVWTNESEGVLQNTDVLLKDGKIAKIGKNLSDASAKVIDGTGKHLTAGIIDEHSHIGAASINDVATNSSMVRIGDVLDSEAINIYRALAGGVVAVQVLHGSANPIGGQSALIKLRWGESPENLKIQGADGFIKFALGENVKRSSNPSSIRYPQTRMGVEQVYVDAFTNAREYEKEWNAYNNLSAKAKPLAIRPRRDLANETILEILNKKRFISCHSYVQSEINMLMKVAERFDFRINTFTHILEGYKVADKMAKHGVAGSTFADWWNYKWEVRYAIPYNAAIMHRAGIVTAINSDDAEMGRRLNQEAAKSVKYAGMSEEDALKMVTLNPAKMLHLDGQMGSIKAGKSADVVLWNDHPLSVYAKPLKTIIDGKVYFDVEKDEANNKALDAERARLVQKMKGAKKAGSPTQRSEGKVKLQFHCDDIMGLDTEQ